MPRAFNNERFRIAVLLAVALVIACLGLKEVGPLWADAPQYSNAGAMLRDWYVSGDYLRPMEFARTNYARYPGFHLPYHPPVYPALLGLFFLIAGVSPDVARIFIALCLWLAGCSFYGVLKRIGVRPGVAWGGALMLISMPLVAYWSRTPMSEIPGLMLILAATFFFLVWLEQESNWAYVAAFALAQAAFLSRYLTAGILPAWFLWALLAGKWRRFFTPVGLLMPAMFIVVSGAWSVFSRRYAAFEINSGQGGPVVRAFSGELFRQHLAFLPDTLGWLLLVGGAASLVILVFREDKMLRRWWLPCWLVCAECFLLAIGIHGEERYLIYALPVFPAALAQLLNANKNGWVNAALIGVLLVAGGIRYAHFSQGIQGHEAIAETMAGWKDRGNVLVNLPLPAELMFRYRAKRGVVPRSFIRGERTLAMRTPVYSGQAPVMLAHNRQDILSTIRKGRIRYFVIAPQGEEENQLLLDTMRNEPGKFERLGETALRNGLVEGDMYKVELWKYTADLPPGSSELPVVVPTAGMSLPAAP